MNKKILIGVIVLVVAAGIVFGFTYFKRNNNGLQYELAAIDKGTVTALVDTTGTLNPVTIVDIGSQVSGNIENIYVDFNSQVKAGQVLAELEQLNFQTKVQQNEANYSSSVAALEKSKVSLENSKKKYDRAKSLFEKELLSFEEFEATETQYFSAKADLQSSEARLEQAKAQLDTSKVDLTYTIIKSPIDGVVINRNVNVGQTVAASFQAPVLFQVANDLTKMQVECSVDEADIGRVKEGQTARFTVDAFPDDNFSGVVKQVRYSPEVIQNVVTYTTIVDVENPEMKLRPGMTATISIVVGEAKNALRVPNSALRFQPSPEVLQALFEEMRREMQAKRGQASQTDGQSEKRRPQGNFQMGHGSGGMGSRMRNRARVWIQDETGKLRMVSIRTGVTDNAFTEITGGDLKEGQEVITGKSTQATSSNRSSSNLRRGMMFMR
ncbi:MAG: efflux RND transporter periplasmic adaptor subunit [Candidatus Aminicenantes bacterium]|nr:MAG: efflux RND transporter periplasmic adaptor subunit [Candidatus Aminicenantes bacterium]